MTEFERRVDFEPAYDKRDSDPSKNYGIHGVNMRWILIGPRGAVQFLVYTNWHVPSLYREWDSQGRDAVDLMLLLKPMPADIGYHWRVPLWHPEPDGSDEDWYSTLMAPHEDCEYLDGAPCYYDGSALSAETVFEKLVTEGGEAVWAEMREWYDIQAERDDAHYTPEKYEQAKADTRRLREEMRNRAG